MLALTNSEALVYGILGGLVWTGIGVAFLIRGRLLDQRGGEAWASDVLFGGGDPLTRFAETRRDQGVDTSGHKFIGWMFIGIGIFFLGSLIYYRAINPPEQREPKSSAVGSRERLVALASPVARLENSCRPWPSLDPSGAENECG